MFNIKIIYIFALFVFLFVGCDLTTKPVESNSTTKKNTLNDSDLGHETGNIQDYFYNFDEEIDAQFLYYSVPYYDGMTNTIQLPSKIDLNKDTLNFRTFPDYLLDVVKDDENLDTRLYPLNESNASANNWCDTLLVQYNGNCPNKVDFNNDGRKTSDGSHENLEVKKDTTFIIHWENIDSLKWLPDKDRYNVVLKQTKYDTAKVSYDDLPEPDLYDSLIYIAIIDTSRITVNSLLYIDRSEWERYDTTYEKSEYSIKLEHTFNYEEIRISQDSLMYRVNSDCNQNGTLDGAEDYLDWGPDWCPDSLETGEGLCIAVDSPCNCLGNWMVDDVNVVNSSWQEAVDNGHHLDALWWYSENWINLDPNGDRWRDCGCDGLCYSDVGWSGADPGNSEGNGIVDCDENFEGNKQYDYDVQKSSGEYFIDVGNTIIDDAEFCKGSIEGSDCLGEFEDRNCNGKWDNAELENNKYFGNGIRDLEEKWRDDNNDNSVQANEIYYIGDKLETYLVNYPQVGSPIPLEGINQSDTIRMKFLTGEDAFYITFDSLITVENIVKLSSASYRPIDSIRTIYTNKVIESKLEGQSSEYYITKTSWNEPVDDDVLAAGRDYDYDYHIFNTDISNGKIIKLIHRDFFKYYGYTIAQDLKSYDESFWVDPSIKEEVYIYTYDNLLRDGEYYFSEDIMFTKIGNYLVKDKYEVAFDDSVSIGIRRNLYDLSSGACLADTSLDVSTVADCPMDSIITNSYKITRTKTFIMLGNGVEFGFRNTFWLGHDEASNKPMGIIKDIIEYRWSEAPWEEYGSSWKEYSRLELRSLRSPNTSLPRILNPIAIISIDQIGEKSQFEFDPYQLSSTFGMHRMRKYYGK